MGGRKLRGYEAEEDRDIITIDLTRDELMIALDSILTKKQKNLRIHKMRERRNSTILRVIANPPMLWRLFKRKIRKHIDGMQQELPLF